MTEPAKPPSPPEEGLLRVAAVQAAPVYLDRDATVRKAVELIGRAGAAGAGLVAFGENFLPGHPLWFHALPSTDARSMALAVELVDNAITIPGDAVDALADAARAANTVVVIGVVERPDPDVSVIHSGQLVFSPRGELMGSRRKVVPAVGERVFLSPGGGESIRVFDSPWGALSALCGGENSNPLLTYALRSLGARIHVASWPPHFHKPGIMHKVMTITGQAVAYQNSAHVIAVAGIADPSIAERVAGTREHRENLEAMVEDPGSMIWAPRGKLLAGPLRGEGILYADIDVAEGAWAQLVNRQYDRPDLLQLFVSNHAQPPGVRFAASTAEPGDGSSETISAATMVRMKYGDQLSAEEVAAVAPYVEQILRRSEQLAALQLATGDPRTTSFGIPLDPS